MLSNRKKDGRGREYNRKSDGKFKLVGNESQEKKLPKVNENSPVIQAFRCFQVELDTRHDKYERLVKLSRDVTIESKRAIFLLHRMTGEDEASASEILSQVGERLKEIQTSKLQLIARELAGKDVYQYIRAYSPGVQEYIEAVTFYHYLKEAILIDHKHLSADLVFKQQVEPEITDVPMSGDAPLSVDAAETIGVESSPKEPEFTPSTDFCSTSVTGFQSLFISPIDYLLGVADLTGELMRKAINSAGTGNLDEPFNLCKFVRQIYDGFVSLDNTSREMNRKMSTLRQSLQKVERACYTLQIRGSEIPKHMLADVLSCNDIVMEHDDDMSSMG